MNVIGGTTQKIQDTMDSTYIKNNKQINMLYPLKNSLSNYNF